MGQSCIPKWKLYELMSYKFKFLLLSHLLGLRTYQRVLPNLFIKLHDNMFFYFYLRFTYLLLYIHFTKFVYQNTWQLIVCLYLRFTYLLYILPLMVRYKIIRVSIILKILYMSLII